MSALQEIDAALGESESESLPKEVAISPMEARTAMHHPECGNRSGDAQIVPYGVAKRRLGYSKAPCLRGDRE